MTRVDHNRLFAEERRRKILELLGAGHSVRVAELGPALGASETSIRRDLRELEAAGLLLRTHGGALTHETAAFEPSLEEKEDRFQPQKRAIARLAAELVRDGDTVVLDAGTTTFEIARLIKQRRNLTVVTNAINIARELAGSEAEVTLTGGFLRGRTQSLVGPIAENVLAALHADRLFLATNGLDLKRGLTTPNLMEAQIKRAMIDSAREVIVVADCSKFGRVTFGRICALDRAHCLITDGGAPAEMVRALRERGLKVLVAGEVTP